MRRLSRCSTLTFNYKMSIKLSLPWIQKTQSITTCSFMLIPELTKGYFQQFSSSMKKSSSQNFFSTLQKLFLEKYEDFSYLKHFLQQGKKIFFVYFLQESLKLFVIFENWNTVFWWRISSFYFEVWGSELTSFSSVDFLSKHRTKSTLYWLNFSLLKPSWYRTLILQPSNLLEIFPRLSLAD